jgi:hypothetical protein
MDTFLGTTRRRGTGALAAVVILLLLMAPAASADVQHESQVLMAGDGGTNHGLGSAVAVCGNTALVGAPGNDAVYVYTRSGGSWSQVQKLEPGDAVEGGFGYSIALTADTAVIGAPWQMRAAKTYAGGAYVFKLTGGSWTQEGVLTVADAAYDQFGTSVALSGDTAVIGASHNSFSGVSIPGTAYVFTRTGTSWSQQQALVATGLAPGDLFGCAVAVDGDTALVGASGHSAGRGEAVAFTRSGQTWSQGSTLSAADGAGDDNLGAALALSGGTALVGAPFHAVGGPDRRGAAYAFVQSAGSWSPQQELTASDGAGGDVFGIAVALSGDAALVGAIGHTVGTATGSGEAYIYARGANVWTEQSRLTAATPDADDQLGASVGFSGGLALAGAPNHDAGGSNAGAAYAFALGPVDRTAPTTAVSGVDTVWHRTPVPVSFTAADEPNGSGVDYTEYSLDGAAYARGSGLTVSTAGEHVLRFRSADKAGNVETEKSVTVRVDTGRPQPLALAKVAVKKGKKATLRFRVNDVTPQATVVIQICKGAKVKKTLKVGQRATNSAQSYSWKCKLAKGTYVWKILATDLAGNTQAKPGSKKLVVK